MKQSAALQHFSLVRAPCFLLFLRTQSGKHHSMSWDLLSFQQPRAFPFMQTAFVASVPTESEFQKLIQAAIRPLQLPRSTFEHTELMTWVLIPLICDPL